MSKVPIQLVMLGNAGVGKTALCMRYMTNTWIDAYDPTVEDSYRKDIVVDDNTTVTLDLLDTAGQAEFHALQDGWIRDGDGYCIVCDVTYKESFENLSDIWDRIAGVRGDDLEFPVCIVGNKMDLTNLQQVTENQIKEFAAEKNCLYKMTSALKNVGVSEAFEELMLETLKRKQVEEPVQPKKGIECCTLL